MKRSAIKRVGKKTKAWNSVRSALKREYEQMGITSCELRYPGCWGETWLTFAHGKKRRHLQGDELKSLVVLACLACHDTIEKLPEAEMTRIVRETIERRPK